MCLLSAALLLQYVGVLGCFGQFSLVSENAFIFSDNGVPGCACLLSCEALFIDFIRIIMVIDLHCWCVHMILGVDLREHDKHAFKHFLDSGTIVNFSCHN